MAFMLKCPDCDQEGVDPRHRESSCTACGHSFTLLLTALSVRLSWSGCRPVARLISSAIVAIAWCPSVVRDLN